MNERDVRIVMEALFDIRSGVYTIPTCSRRTTMKRKRRKRTPEEREEELRRREDLTRRLQERIDYYRAREAAAEQRGDTK